MGLHVGPDGALYWAHENGDEILRADKNGTTQFLVSTDPTEITFAGPNHDIYTTNFGSGQVSKFDGITHAFDGVVAAVPGNVIGLTSDAAGNIYFSTRGDSIYKYDGTNTTTFATSILPEDCFVMNGLLYATSIFGPGAFRYNLDGTPKGANGNPVDPTFTSGAGNYYSTSATIGPDRNLYVSDYFAGAVHVFDGVTGAFVQDLNLQGPQIQGAWGITFGQPVPESPPLLVLGLGFAVLAKRRARR